jgi:hypothetical protein
LTSTGPFSYLRNRALWEQQWSMSNPYSCYGDRPIVPAFLRLPEPSLVSSSSANGHQPSNIAYYMGKTWGPCLVDNHLLLRDFWLCVILFMVVCVMTLPRCRDHML